MKKPNMKSKIISSLIVHLCSFQMILLPFNAYGIDFSNIDTGNVDTSSVDLSNIDTEAARDQINDLINDATPEEIAEAQRRAEEAAAENGITQDNALDQAQEFADQNGIDTSSVPTDIPSSTTGAGTSVAEAESNQEQAEQQQQVAQEAATQAAEAAAAAQVAQQAAEAAAAAAQAAADQAAAEAAQITDARERALAQAAADAEAERARIALEQAQAAAAAAQAAATQAAATEAARIAAGEAAAIAEAAAAQARVQARLEAERQRQAAANPTSTAGSTQCPTGQTFNELTGACLTSGETLLVQTQEGRCNELSGAEKDRCLGNIQELAQQAQNAIDNNRQPASSDAPAGSAAERKEQATAAGQSTCNGSPEALRCQAAGHVFNCKLNFCATQEEQTELAANYVGCKLKGSAEAEAKCIGELEDKVATRVASGGVLCDSDQSNEAASCRAQGRTWNCNYSQCLGDEMVDHLKGETKQCSAIEDQAQKDTCYAGLKDKAVAFIASGKNCDNSGNEKAAACAAEGKTWNCNVNYCLTEDENNMLAGEVVSCQNKPDTAQKSMCMAGLEDKAVDYLLFRCDLSENPAGQACNEGGKQWNCKLNVCLSADDNQRLINAYKNCNNKPTEAEKKQCFDEIKMLADAAQQEGGNISDKLKEGEKKVKMASGVGTANAALVAAVGAVVGVAALVGAMSFCISGGINIVTGGLAVVNEMNNGKKAKKAMKQLREDYAVLEKKMGEQGISYELQVEAFQFYLRAAKTAKRIAGDFKKGYQTQMIMFGIAIAIAAIEAVVYAISQNWDKVACAGVNGGVATFALMNSTMLFAAAKKAEKDYGKLASKVQKLLNLFEKHFKNKGGASAARFARDYKDVETDNGERNKLARTAMPNGEENKGIQSSDIGVGQDQNACANKAGQLDQNCSCKRTNSCASASVNSLAGLGDNGANFSEKHNIADSFNDINRINSGEINASDLDSRKLNKNATRFRNLANKLLRTTLNPALKKAGKPIIQNDEEGRRAFTKKAATPENMALAGFSQMKLNLNKFVPKGTELEKEIDSQGIRAPSSIKLAAASPTAPNIDFDDELLEEEQPLEEFAVNEGDKKLSNADMLSQAEPVYDYSSVGGTVIKNANLSLFKVISNRYNVLRLEQRFGTRK